METILARIESAGGSVWADGSTLRYRIPEGSVRLIDELRTHKAEAFEVLQQRKQSSGVSAVAPSRFGMWETALCAPAPNLKAPWCSNARSYRVTRREAVYPPCEPEQRGGCHDPEVWIMTALEQLQAALKGDAHASGGWSVAVLVERLHAFGVTVDLVQ